MEPTPHCQHWSVICSRVASPFARERGRVRVDSGAWGCKREPLTSVLSPWLKGTGGKDRYVAIPTYESTNTAARSDYHVRLPKWVLRLK
jgi:hypothetical protein